MLLDSVRVSINIDADKSGPCFPCSIGGTEVVIGVGSSYPIIQIFPSEATVSKDGTDWYEFNINDATQLLVQDSLTVSVEPNRPTSSELLHRPPQVLQISFVETAHPDTTEAEAEAVTNID